MATKHKAAVIFFFAFAVNFFVLTPCLSAQSTTVSLSPGYYITTEGGVPRFVQRFVWRGDEYTYRYEVILERLENDRTIPHIREFTTSPFIEVSLSPGVYRVRVIPYDIFDMPGAVSGWRVFEVLHAHQPQVSEAHTEIITDDYGSPLGFIVDIYGTNLDPDAEYFLHHPDNTQTKLNVIESGDNSVKIFVDSENLDSGLYDIIVKNPGGLEAKVGETVISNVIQQIRGDNIEIPEIEPEPEPELELEPESELEPQAEPEPEPELQPEPEPVDYSTKFPPLKKVLFKFGFSWVPSFPIYGEQFEFFLENFNARFSALAYIPVDIYIGPEVMIYWLGDIVAAGINLSTEKWLSNELFSVGFRVGAAIPIMNSDFFYMMNTGLSFSWRVTNHFLIETGVNYLHIFGDASSGSINPWIGVGLQF